MCSAGVCVSAVVWDEGGFDLERRLRVSLVKLHFVTQQTSHNQPKSNSIAFYLQLKLLLVDVFSIRTGTYL